MRAWPFSTPGVKRDASLLLAQVTQASRERAFFGPDRVPDTLEGRFELVAVFAALALIRLRLAKEGEPLAQMFVDLLFRDLDSGLREDGVGDLAVSKRVHKLASAFYGRLDAYAGALEDEDREALKGALARNVRGCGHVFAATLAEHVRRVAAVQASAPWEHLLTGETWPDFAT